MLDEADMTRLREVFVPRESCNLEMDAIKETLSGNREQLAVLSTKMNVLMAILGAIGTGVIGILLKMVIGG